MTATTPTPRHAGKPHEVHDGKQAAITAALLERARCDEATVPLIVASVVIPAIGLWLTVSPVAPVLGFVALPALYWLLLAGMLLAYMLLTQGAKSWFHRRYGD